MENTDTLRQYRGFKVFTFWLGAVGATIIFVVAALAIYSVRQYMPAIGMIYLGAIAVTPVIAIAWLTVYFMKWLYKPDNIELGPSGNVFRHFGKTTEYHPLGIKEHAASKAQKATVSEDTFIVPALVDLLKNGQLGNMDLLLGFHADGTARYGLWDDLRTFIIAGKSRSGKTVTLIFFLLQALLVGARVYVCDLHYRKKDGLLKILEPLMPHLIVARNEQEISEVTAQFRDEMHSRETGTDCSVPCLFVVDEWTYTLRSVNDELGNILVDTYLDCAEAYSAFNGFSIIAGHEWTARESGKAKGTAIRRNTHSVCVHKLDEEYAKFLLQGTKGKKAAKVAPVLKRGSMFLQDSEGELDTLHIPYYGKEREAIYEVLQMLTLLAPVDENLMIEASATAAQDTQQQAQGPVIVNETGMHTYTPETELESPVNRPVNTGVNTMGNIPETPVNRPVNSFEDSVHTELEDIKGTISMLNALGIAHRTIARAVHLDGRKYGQYQELCRDLGITISDDKVKL
jgi:hypothetical protein